MAEGKTTELRGQWMQGLTGSASGVIYNLDSAGRTAYVSSSVRDVLGWEASELRTKPIFDIVPEADQEVLRDALVRTLHGGQEVDLEFRARHRSGQEVFVEATMVRADGADGQAGVVLRFRDVTQRKNTELELRGMVSWFRALTRNSGDVIIVVGADENHRFVSGSADAVLGYPPDELTREVFLDAIHPRDRMGTVLVMEGVRHQPEGSARHTFRLQHRKGEWRHVELLAVNRLSDPDISGLILYLRDVTEQRLRDDLTELPNRNLFVDRLQEAVDDKDGGLFAVALLELDRYELVKGTLGPEISDKMVVQFARRLQRLATAGAMVARVGGAEFAVLLPDLETPQDAPRQIQALGASVEEAFHLAAQEVFSGLTVGLALSSRGYTRADAMLRDAEGALQKARTGGSGEAVANTEVMASQHNRLLLESDLVGAIERQEFRVHYQPLFSAKKRTITGFEALVRWNHPRDGLVAPGRFIGVAEETGLIVQIGEAVLRRACQQLVRWNERVAGTEHLTMAVNLSAVQLRDDGLVDLVASVLQEYRVAPSQLKLEVTETAIIDRPGQAGRVLSMLKDLGVQLALDDFGTGYSSLSYLSSYPFDFLKIDRSFVSGPRGLDSWGRAAKLLEGVIQLGHTLELEVIAEGVEEESQAKILASLGCDLLQGYHLARPAGPKAIRALLEKKR